MNRCHQSIYQKPFRGIVADLSLTLQKFSKKTTTKETTKVRFLATNYQAKTDTKTDA
jgi:hypothetical protein